jgi:hypothetical protein
MGERSMSLVIEDGVGFMILVAMWLGVATALLAACVRHVLAQRRLERAYRLRLAHWRAGTDSV